MKNIIKKNEKYNNLEDLKTLTNNLKKWLMFLIFITAVTILLNSCSKYGEIEGIIDKPNTIAIIKITDGHYWIIPGKGIEKIDGDTLFVKGDVLVTYGKGEGNTDKIVESLVNSRETQSGSYQATESTITEHINGKQVITKLTDCFTGVTTNDIKLEIKEVVGVKTGKYRRTE